MFNWFKREPTIQDIIDDRTASVKHVSGPVTPKELENWEKWLPSLHGPGGWRELDWTRQVIPRLLADVKRFQVLSPTDVDRLEKEVEVGRVAARALVEFARLTSMPFANFSYYVPQSCAAADACTWVEKTAPAALKLIKESGLLEGDEK